MCYIEQVIFELIPKVNNAMQKIFNEAKAIIKEDACIKYYDETKLIYIEMDASGVGLGATLLQTRNSSSCAKDEVPDNSILRPMHPPANV